MKALALLSGGLDSTLAIRVILEQGIEVEAVNFFTPFCQCSRKSGCGGYEAKRVTDSFGVKLKVFILTTEYFEIIKAPKYGYGKNLNPCIDCRILMHKKAKEYMEEKKASFIITGEVLGQRPMSQHKAALNLIDKESGLKGLVLRPLSARLLSETIPEKERWVNREKLLGISGRSRKPQMTLALNYEIGDYPCPAGGCLLTDLGFCRRLKDLMNYSEIDLNNIELLKIGRHFRLSERAKVIVGRNKEENEKLTHLRKAGDIYFYPLGDKGPVAIGRGRFSDQDIVDISKIIVRYCDDNKKGNIKIASRIWPDGTFKVLVVEAAEDSELQRLRL
jgi:tRNA U34 2-thiouridine synthase MnmA/TrmU